MDFKRIIRIPKQLVLSLVLVFGFSISSPAIASVSDTKIQTLEHNFQKITNQLYTSLAKTLPQCSTRSSSLIRLNIQTQELSQQNKNVIAICLIQNNFALIKESIDSKEVFPIFQYLLDINDFLLANKLYALVKGEGDKTLLSNYSFMYAQYYLKRKKWKKVLYYIYGTYNDLTAEDANFARLITGIALQKIKKHRTAVKIYSKIPLQSQYYPEARLNIATAYIRQDWWTDAHIKINEIIHNKKFSKNKEMINRLYLVLGYSLLRKEFYRDAREAFRNIELDSKYFNKALLGIALTATNQDDHIGALNAITILKAKKSFDLSVDESYLLLPYSYEKLNQNMTASASYTDAQKYYQERINTLTLLKNKPNYNVDIKSILATNHLNIENNIIDFSRYYPVSFLRNNLHLKELSQYVSHIKNTALNNKYKKLVKKYNQTTHNMYKNILERRLAYLNSYLNQSRFGLARLFDNSSISK